MSTGTPQDFTSAGALGGRVGPLPNLKAALANQLGSPVTDTVSRPWRAEPGRLDRLVARSTAVPVTISWAGSDTGGSGLARYVLWQSTNGVAYQQVTLASPLATSIVRSLEPGNSLHLRHRCDRRGRQPDARVRAGLHGRRAPGDEHGDRLCGQLDAQPLVSRVRRLPAHLERRERVCEADVHGSVGGVDRAEGDQPRPRPRVPRRCVRRHSRPVRGDDHSADGLFSRTFPTVGSHTLTVVAEGTSGRPSVDVDAFIVLR